MGRYRTYIISGGLTLLAFMAMGWAALPPPRGSDDNLSAGIKAAARDLATWYDGRPLDGSPDWENAARAIHAGDAGEGRRLMLSYGCGACHQIPGIAEARGRVGPALDRLGGQAYIAGVLPNRPGGLVRWIVAPTVHSPQTAMPDLGVSEAEARHMAAYLYSVGGS
ncbi:c-type cytochrome [Roseicitreum antarcticum]|uniref:Cytochrome c n=1 Tax=Roseicitreum antarcticum TaxID=564137 RepID=A0A1H2VG90_9RHOB|nr:c-type cytochrome [Roseicitreum antarcticum]SDW67220.1 Cytochrome c [Roseicitreum antarcticum]